MSDKPNPTAALITALWQKNKPLVLERVQLLQRAAESAQTSSLAKAQREEAMQAAHKLAGSLGMYGYADAGRNASEMEHMLDGDAPIDAARLSVLAMQLQQQLFPE